MRLMIDIGIERENFNAWKKKRSEEYWQHVYLTNTRASTLLYADSGFNLPYILIGFVCHVHVVCYGVARYDGEPSAVLCVKERRIGLVSVALIVINGHSYPVTILWLRNLG